MTMARLHLEASYLYIYGSACINKETIDQLPPDAAASFEQSRVFGDLPRRD
jgi:hypothetical protein